MRSTYESGVTKGENLWRTNLYVIAVVMSALFCSLKVCACCLNVDDIFFVKTLPCRQECNDGRVCARDCHHSASLYFIVLRSTPSPPCPSPLLTLAPAETSSLKLTQPLASRPTMASHDPSVWFPHTRSQHPLDPCHPVRFRSNQAFRLRR